VLAEVGDAVGAAEDVAAAVDGGLDAVPARRVAPAGGLVRAQALRREGPGARAAGVAARPRARLRGLRALPDPAPCSTDPKALSYTERGRERDCGFDTGIRNNKIPHLCFRRGAELRGRRARPPRGGAPGSSWLFLFARISGELHYLFETSSFVPGYLYDANGMERGSFYRSGAPPKMSDHRMPN
jgi:hypothetical protein